MNCDIVLFFNTTEKVVGSGTKTYYRLVAMGNRYLTERGELTRDKRHAAERGSREEIIGFARSLGYSRFQE